MNNLKETEEAKKKGQVLPEKIKNDVALFAWKYGIIEARRYDTSKHPQCEFKREPIRGGKAKY